MACVNPARAAGATDRGELKLGNRADVIILDKEFNVKHVFVKGEQIRLILTTSTAGSIRTQSKIPIRTNGDFTFHSWLCFYKEVFV